MERLIVSISRRGEGELDLEVPADLPVGDLIQELTLALGWDQRGQIYADPPGRVLAPNETLAQAGVWEGARLLFQSQEDHGGPRPSLPPPAPPGEGPVRGWRPLDLGQPSGSRSPSPSDAPFPTASGSFVWKRIDED